MYILGAKAPSSKTKPPNYKGGSGSSVLPLSRLNKSQASAHYDGVEQPKIVKKKPVDDLGGNYESAKDKPTAVKKVLREQSGIARQGTQRSIPHSSSAEDLNPSYLTGVDSYGSKQGNRRLLQVYKGELINTGHQTGGSGSQDELLMQNSKTPALVTASRQNIIPTAMTQKAPEDKDTLRADKDQISRKMMMSSQGLVAGIGPNGSGVANMLKKPIGRNNLLVGGTSMNDENDGKAGELVLSESDNQTMKLKKLSMDHAGIGSNSKGNKIVGIQYNEVVKTEEDLDAVVNLTNQHVKSASFGGHKNSYKKDDSQVIMQNISIPQNMHTSLPMQGFPSLGAGYSPCKIHAGHSSQNQQENISRRQILTKQGSENMIYNDHQAIRTGTGPNTNKQKNITQQPHQTYEIDTPVQMQSPAKVVQQQSNDGDISLSVLNQATKLQESKLASISIQAELVPQKVPEAKVVHKKKGKRPITAGSRRQTALQDSPSIKKTDQMPNISDLPKNRQLKYRKDLINLKFYTTLQAYNNVPSQASSWQPFQAQNVNTNLPWQQFKEKANQFAAQQQQNAKIIYKTQENMTSCQDLNKSNSKVAPVRQELVINSRIPGNQHICSSKAQVSPISDKSYPSTIKKNPHHFSSMGNQAHSQQFQITQPTPTPMPPIQPSGIQAKAFNSYNTSNTAAGANIATTFQPLPFEAQGVSITTSNVASITHNTMNPKLGNSGQASLAEQRQLKLQGVNSPDLNAKTNLSNKNDVIVDSQMYHKNKGYNTHCVSNDGDMVVEPSPTNVSLALKENHLLNQVSKKEVTTTQEDQNTIQRKSQKNLNDIKSSKNLMNILSEQKSPPMSNETRAKPETTKRSDADADDDHESPTQFVTQNVNGNPQQRRIRPRTAVVTMHGNNAKNQNRDSLNKYQVMKENYSVTSNNNQLVVYDPNKLIKNQSGLDQIQSRQSGILTQGPSRGAKPDVYQSNTQLKNPGRYQNHYELSQDTKMQYLNLRNNKAAASAIGNRGIEDKNYQRHIAQQKNGQQKLLEQPNTQQSLMLVTKASFYTNGDKQVNKLNKQKRIYSGTVRNKHKRLYHQNFTEQQPKSQARIQSAVVGNGVGAISPTNGTRRPISPCDTFSNLGDTRTIAQSKDLQHVKAPSQNNQSQKVATGALRSSSSNWIQEEDIKDQNQLAPKNNLDNNAVVPAETELVIFEKVKIGGKTRSIGRRPLSSCIKSKRCERFERKALQFVAKTSNSPDLNRQVLLPLPQMATTAICESGFVELKQEENQVQASTFITSAPVVHIQQMKKNPNVNSATSLEITNQAAYQTQLIDVNSRRPQTGKALSKGPLLDQRYQAKQFEKTQVLSNQNNAFEIEQQMPQGMNLQNLFCIYGPKSQQKQAKFKLTQQGNKGEQKRSGRRNSADSLGSGNFHQQYNQNDQLLVQGASSNRTYRQLSSQKEHQLSQQLSNFKVNWNQDTNRSIENLLQLKKAISQGTLVDFIMNNPAFSTRVQQVDTLQIPFVQQQQALQIEPIVSKQNQTQNQEKDEQIETKMEENKGDSNILAICDKPNEEVQKILTEDQYQILAKAEKQMIQLQTTDLDEDIKSDILPKDQQLFNHQQMLALTQGEKALEMIQAVSNLNKQLRSRAQYQNDSDISSSDDEPEDEQPIVVRLLDSMLPMVTQTPLKLEHDFVAKVPTQSQLMNDMARVQGKQRENQFIDKYNQAEIDKRSQYMKITQLIHQKAIDNPSGYLDEKQLALEVGQPVNMVQGTGDTSILRVIQPPQDFTI